MFSLETLTMMFLLVDTMKILHFSYECSLAGLSFGVVESKAYCEFIVVLLTAFYE